VRIALVCPYSLSVPGGVQQQVVGLARALAVEGHEVEVLAPLDSELDRALLRPLGGRRSPAAETGEASRAASWHEGAEEGLAEAGPDDDRSLRLVGVGRSLRLPANGSRAPVAPWPGAMRRTLFALAAGYPEVVHVHEPLVPGPALAALARSRAPLVGTFHRSGATRGYRLAGRVLAPLARRLRARVAVSDEARATASAVLGEPEERFAVLPNAVDLEALAAAPPFPSLEPAVLFLGRHEARKGLGVLLRAFRDVPPPARLWVAGEGPETRRLAAAHADLERVDWLGTLPEAAKASRLAGATLLAAPALGGESFGVVLLEAMAAGTAVVASDIPGYRLAGGDAVAFVPPGDATALAAELRRLLDDAEAREELVRRGRRRAVLFGFDRLAASYLDIYEQALRSP